MGEHDECVPDKSTNFVQSGRYDLNQKRISLSRPETSRFKSKLSV